MTDKPVSAYFPYDDLNPAHRVTIGTRVQIVLEGEVDGFQMCRDEGAPYLKVELSGAVTFPEQEGRKPRKFMGWERNVGLNGYSSPCGTWWAQGVVNGRGWTLWRGERGAALHTFKRAVGSGFFRRLADVVEFVQKRSDGEA